MIFELAHQMGALPLATLLVLLLRGKRRDAGLWWLAAGFLVSWAADWFPHFGNPPAVVATVYPVGQAGLMFPVLMSRRTAAALLLLSGTAAIVAILLHGLTGPEFLSRAVAWGAIVVAASQRPALGWVAFALVLYFGLGLLAWAGYTALPGWTTWGAYQGARFLGLVTFSVAVWRQR